VEFSIDCAADEESLEYEQVAQHSREMAPLGLKVLRVLSEEYSAAFSEDTVLTVISFTGPKDPWTTQEACDLAGALMTEQLAHHQDLSTLNEGILKGYLRPLFSKSKPKAVTASGRKAAFPEEDDTHRGLMDETKEVKPWKYVDHRATTVFQWVVSTATVSELDKRYVYNSY
jgi:hypothetical protein